MSYCEDDRDPDTGTGWAVTPLVLLVVLLFVLGFAFCWLEG